MGLFDGAEDPLSEVGDALSDFGQQDESDALEEATRRVQAAIDRIGGMPQTTYRFLLGTDWDGTVPTDHVGWEDALKQAGRVADNMLLRELGEDRNYGSLAATGINQLLDEEAVYQQPVHRVLDFEVEEGLSQPWRATVTLAIPCQASAANVATGKGSEVTNIGDRFGEAFGIEGDGTDIADLGALAGDALRGWLTPDALAADLSDAQDPDRIDFAKLPVDHAQDPTLPEAYLGRLARFSIARRLGPSFYTLNERWLTGTVVGFEDRGGNVLGLRVVRLTLAPHLHRLGLRRRYRIFRDKNAIEILSLLLDEHGIYPEAPGDAGVTARRYEPGGAELFGPIGVPDALTAAVDKIAGAVPFGLGEGVGDAVDSVIAQSIEGWRPKRDYCVQYGETDLEFVERLLAEEGLSFFFEHRERRETLVVCEDPRLAGRKVLTAGRLPLSVLVTPPNPTAQRNNEVAWDVAVARRPVPSGVTLRDRCYARPTDPMDLAAGEAMSLLSPSGLSSLSTAGGLEQMANQVVGLATELTGAPGTEDYAGPEAQWFEWPGRLAFPAAEPPEPLAYDNYDGPPMAQLRLDGLRATGAVARGQSDCATLSPGAHAQLLHHPFDVLHPPVHKPQRVLVTRVKHTLGWDGTAVRYRNEFEAQSAALAYRPPPPARRPRISGVQTAVVIDVSGEVSVQPHESAWRVRVRFPWERDGEGDGSNWIRFTQPYTGAGFGALFVPRVGMEVVVGFEEGDPDRPTVLGTLYAAPYEAPAGARHASIPNPESAEAGRISELARMTESGIATHAWPQDAVGERARQNRLRFDDHANQERIDVFAQRDLAEEVGRDHVTSVRRDQVNAVGGTQRESVGGDQTLIVRHPSEGDEDWGRDVHVLGDETVAIGAGVIGEDGAAGEEVSDEEAPAAEEGAAGEEGAAAGPTLAETIEESDTLEVGASRTLHVKGTQERLTIGAESASEERPGRLLKVVGDSTVEIEENDEIFVTGDRRVRAQGPYALVAKKIDLETPAAAPDGGEGPYEKTGSLEVSEEGVALASKGDALIECDHLEAKADRVLVKAKKRIAIHGNGHSMILDELTRSVSFVAAAGTELRMGNDDAHIHMEEDRFALVAGQSSWVTELAGDGTTSALDAPTGQVKLSAEDELHVNAPSIVLGEPGEG